MNDPSSNPATDTLFLENPSSHYSEISLTESLSPSGRVPSITDSLLLNWQKYLPFTMCQLFLQSQKLSDSEQVCVAFSSMLCLNIIPLLTCKTLNYTSWRSYPSPSLAGAFLYKIIVLKSLCIIFSNIHVFQWLIWTRPCLTNLFIYTFCSYCIHFVHELCTLFYSHYVADALSRSC